MLFLIFLATCMTAGSTGALFPPGKWYESLDKPRWTPPDWVFPAAWTTLYLCISAAAARAAPLDESGYAMAVFALQIALNTLWTPVFFGLRKMAGGMLVIVGLWISVAGTMGLFWELDTIAGLLFAPYLLWVTIAAALNYSVWRRNPQAAAA